MAKSVRECLLDEAGMEEISEAIRAFVFGSTIGRREAAAAWLAFDDALLAWGEHFGSQTKALVILEHRGEKSRITVRVEGERCDPRDVEVSETWSSTLCEFAGITPTYAYRRGCNNLTLVHPQRPLGVLIKILMAAASGAIVATAGFALLPDETRQFLLENLFDRFFDLYVEVLGGMAGPLVFFSVAWGICGIGDTASLARYGKVLLRKFSFSMVLAGVMAVIACVFIFPLSGSVGEGDGGFVENITTMLVGLVPTSFIKPFVDGNTLQIIVLATGVGITALALGETTKGVRSAIRQCNSILLSLMEQICRLLPLFIFVMVVTQSWTGTLATLFSSWFPMLVSVGLMAVFLFALFIYESARLHVPFMRLVRTCMPVFVLGLSTASSSASLGLMMSTCEEELQVDSEFTSFGIPLGIIVCKTGAVLEFVVLMFFAAQTVGMGGNLAWYIHVGIVCVLYSIVVPPVPGGMVACMSLMLAELGIPRSILSLATAMDIILDYPSTGVALTANVLEVFSAASELELVGRDADGERDNVSSPQRS